MNNIKKQLLLNLVREHRGSSSNLVQGSSMFFEVCAAILLDFSYLLPVLPVEKGRLAGPGAPAV